jgi:hypothetical protein
LTYFDHLSMNIYLMKKLHPTTFEPIHFSELLNFVAITIY